MLCSLLCIGVNPGGGTITRHCSGAPMDDGCATAGDGIGLIADGGG